MWHEARKQERKIRGMLVDYRKRAERRQDFYEKIKADPTQFMQVYGRKCKIHLDPAVSAAGDGSAIIVPWQGQQDNLIDRFDVRAHLDFIAPIPKVKELEDISAEERQCNYERYRILAQNDFLGITEDKYLHQLHLEEQFGANAQLEAERSLNKKKPSGGAAIGYSYDDNDATTPFSHILSLPAPVQPPPVDPENDSDSEVDMDVSIDITKLDTNQAHELNGCGRNYGMKSNDFYSFLTKDADEADALRLAREEEQEKIMLSGRKSRRERRAQRERRFAGRTLSPPSYAAKEEPAAAANINENDSDSRSPSPENSGKITYITSFGGEDELQPHSKISINLQKPQKAFGIGSGGNQIGPNLSGKTLTYAEKVKENLEKLKEMNQIKRNNTNSPKKPMQYLRGRSPSRSRSRSRYRRRRSRSRSFSRGRSFRNRRGRRRSSSYTRARGRRSRTRSRSRSRSRSHRDRRYDRSRSRSSKKYIRNRKKTRSPSSSSSSSSSTSSGSHVRRQLESPSHKPSFSKSPSQTKSRSRSISVVSQKTNIINNTSRTLSKQSNGSQAALPPPPPLLPALLPQPVPMETLPVPPSTNASTVESPKMVLDQLASLVESPPEVPIKRYYGRKKEDLSSSEEDNDDEIEDEPMDTANTERSNPLPVTTTTTTTNELASISSSASSLVVVNNNVTNTTGTELGNPSTSTTGKTLSSFSDIKVANSITTGKTNLRERLKRKMQMLLNKQYKADKKAEIERTERQIQQQQEREDEMRELALKLRRRQRELRHKYGTPTSSPSKSSSRSSANDPDEIIEKMVAPILETVRSPIRKSYTHIENSREIDRVRDHGSPSSNNRTRGRSPSNTQRSRRTRSRSRSRRSSSRNIRSNRQRDRSRDRDRGGSRDRDRDRDHDRGSRDGRARSRDDRRNRDRNSRDRDRDSRGRNDRDRSRERDRNRRGHDSRNDRPNNDWQRSGNNNNNRDNQSRYRRDDDRNNRDRDRDRDRERDKDRNKEREKDRNSNRSPKLSKRLVDY